MGSLADQICNPQVQSFLDLIHTAEFAELNKRLSDDVFTWVQFQRLRMPQGYTALDMWKLFSALRRQTAYLTPTISWYMPQNNLPVWMSFNSSIAVQLQQITSRCETWQRIGSVTGISHLRHLHRLADDLSAGLLRDGVMISPDNVYAVMTGAQAITTDTQRVVANAFALLRDTHRVTRHQLTLWTLEDLVTTIDEDVQDVGLGAPSARPFPNPPSMPTAQDVQSFVCHALNSCVQKPRREAFIDLMLISGLFADLKPLPKWNGVCEVILRHAYLEKSGLALLGEVPFSHLLCAWERDELDPSYGVDQGFNDVNPYIGEDADGTAFIGFVIRIHLEYLRLVDEQADRDAQANTDLSDGLNARQTHVLNILEENRSEALTFERYRALYGVSRGTARNDLLALEERGLLASTYRGRALVFQAVANRERQ